MFNNLTQLFSQNVIAFPTFEEEIETVINPNDMVWFYDDDTDEWSNGIYIGFYCDRNPAGESSPYWGESVADVDRMVIYDVVRNSDGSHSKRVNYILPEYIYTVAEYRDMVYGD